MFILYSIEAIIHGFDERKCEDLGVDGVVWYWFALRPEWNASFVRAQVLDEQAGTGNASRNLHALVPFLSALGSPKAMNALFIARNYQYE